MWDIQLRFTRSQHLQTHLSALNQNVNRGRGPRTLNSRVMAVHPQNPSQ